MKKLAAAAITGAAIMTGAVIAAPQTVQAQTMDEAESAKDQAYTDAKSDAQNAEDTAQKMRQMPGRKSAACRRHQPEPRKAAPTRQATHPTGPHQP